MKRLEIHISYSCTNNCIFCSEKNRLQRFKNYKVDLRSLKKLLKEKRAEGFNHVNFTGGEPTLYVNFEELLKYTKDLGYKIYLGSNGIFWADNNNCHEILPLIDELSLSLHGSDEKTHNHHTRNIQSFNKIVQGSENINNYLKNNKNIYFFTNIVVTNQNLNQVDKIIELVSQLENLKQVLISNIAPEGEAYKKYKTLAVPYQTFKEKIPNWVKLANRKNLTIRFFGLPLCVLGDFNVYSNDLSWDERTTFELGLKDHKIILKEKGTILERKRVKINQCNKCSFNEICGGVFSRYLELFGDKEIIKIT